MEEGHSLPAAHLAGAAAAGARPELLYLDNAATSFPKPAPVIAAVTAALGECLSIARSTPVKGQHAAEAVRDCRSRMARFIGAVEPEEIVFTYSATDGLNTALRGFVKPSSHVIVSPLEHHSVMRPLHQMHAESGVCWTALPADAQGHIDPDALKKMVRAETSCIVINHVSNVSGTLQPIAEIGKLAAELGLPYIVDAAQSAGCHHIDVAEIGCDALAMPGHKSMFSLPGTGVLYLRKGREIAPFRSGGTGMRSEELMQPEERPLRYESGTPNIPGIIGLGAALDWFAETGLANVERHSQEMTARLIEGLARMRGIELIGPPARPSRGNPVSFNITGSEPLVVSQILAEHYRISTRAGLHCAPTAHQHFGTYERGGTVRLSVGWFTTPEQLDYALVAIHEIARELAA